VNTENYYMTSFAIFNFQRKLFEVCVAQSQWRLDCGLENPIFVVRSHAGKEMYLFSAEFRTALQVHPTFYSMRTAGILPVLERQGHESNRHML